MPLFGPDPLDILILKEVKQVHDLCRVGFDTLADAAERNLRCCRKQGERLDDLENKLNLALAMLLEIRAMLAPKLSSIAILTRGANPMDFTVNVGESKTTFVAGFDQNNQPFAIDFAANPPAWTVDNAAILNIAPNPTTATDEDATGVSAGTAVESVSCAGFTATSTFTVVAAPPRLDHIEIQAR